MTLTHREEMFDICDQNLLSNISLDNLFYLSQVLSTKFFSFFFFHNLHNLCVIFLYLFYVI
jgi:hypothetical protein